MKYILETEIDFDPGVLEAVITKGLSRRVPIKVKVAPLATGQNEERRVENNINQSTDCVKVL
jgi:hypothetical protein